MRTELFLKNKLLNVGSKLYLVSTEIITFLFPQACASFSCISTLVNDTSIQTVALNKKLRVIFLRLCNQKIL